jgi:hypothetical protein
VPSFPNVIDVVDDNGVVLQSFFSFFFSFLERILFRELLH